jgi:inhibitor of KinA
LIEWPAKVDVDLLKDLINFKEKLEQELVEQIVYVKSAYTSILIVYKSTINNIYDHVKVLKGLYSTQKIARSRPVLRWKIPVCYDRKFAWDMDALVLEKNCSEQDIIDLHTRPFYTVFCIGFLPGFVYLGGLDEKLHHPRKDQPRSCIEPGAVGIGGTQTGVYPSESPGGWNVIGNSPLSFFNMARSTPCFARPGDQIVFYPIGLKQHRDILTLDQAGVYQLESEEVHG